MPHAFVQLTAEIAEACAHAIVLTPTERLGRHLLAAYNEHERNRGRSAWDTPRVYTVERYLAGRLLARRASGSGLPRLLSAEQTYLLFRRTAPAGAERMTPFAMRTFADCHAWEVPFDARHFGATENGRLFLHWAERVQAELERTQAVTAAELPRLLADDAGADTFGLLAFENTPRSIASWLAAQAKNGVVCVTLDAVPKPDAKAVRYRFDDPALELAAITRWCRARLMAADERVEAPRIGVVIPDLADRYTSVLRAFTAEFDPWLEAGDGPGPFDLGGGIPLSATPIWQAADGWLALCCDRVPAAAALATLNNRYLELPRAARLPETVPGLADLADLARHLPGLRGLGLPAPGAQRRTLGRWGSEFAASLDAAGWTGARAGSSQFQAHRQIRARLALLAGDPGTALLEARAALNILRGLLDSVVFAPERTAAPIQVMGYLETTGLCFTDLWVAGLDDERWPALPGADPFLPFATRRRLSLPRSTPALEVEFARERLRHWRRASDRLAVSYARSRGDGELRASPLLDGIPEAVFQGETASGTITESPPAREPCVEDRARPVDAGRLAGGVGVLRDQALCPFRGWAIHRLGLAEPRAPHSLPDPLDRGIAAHEALHALGRIARLEGVGIAELGVGALDEAARAALGQGFERFPERFRQREHARLVHILKSWQALESRRDPIDIEALEESTQLELEGLTLSVRIDRVDRCAGGLAVIDYKTGRPGSLAAGARPAEPADRPTSEAEPGAAGDGRLTEPQLPLYALADPNVRAVLYAEVRPERAQLTGIADPALALAPAKVGAPAGGSWERQIAIWRAQLAELAAEVRDGFAAVAPVDANVCGTCHLASLCRIRADPPAEPDDGR